MTTRKSMTLPIIIAFIFIVIIVYLFANIKQSQITCSKTKSFDSNMKIVENLISYTDGKKITGLELTKTISLPNKFSDSEHLNQIENALNNTLEYLGDSVKYNVLDNKIVVKVRVNKNEIVLLDNIELFDNGDIQIKINSNTKSSDLVALSVGEVTSDGELMKRLKNNGYSCN